MGDAIDTRGFVSGRAPQGGRGLGIVLFMVARIRIKVNGFRWLSLLRAAEEGQQVDISEIRGGKTLSGAPRPKGQPVGELSAWGAAVHGVDGQALKMLC